LSEGKKILIDGQQRITALTASIIGTEVIDDKYKKVRIKISFNPINEKFEAQNPAILRDKTWLPDISEISNGSVIKTVKNYLSLNPNVDADKIEKTITNLINISQKQIGLIELNSDLDIETVTEIFIRINSKGVVLSQANFAMSKIASHTKYNGNEIRKTIDYFCRLSISPKYYQHIVDNDKEFSNIDEFRKISWLKDEKDDLYDPDYNDLLRVAFTSQFERGKLSDLVSLLSGRNFETRTFEASIAESSFANLKIGIDKFVSETNFKRFIMIIKSAGFISPKLIRSQNVLNFAYIFYLKLIDLKVNSALIEHYVRRWHVYSILTGRYSGSPESAFDYDIKQISSKPIAEILKEREEAELSEAFWNASLPQSLDSSVANSPYFLVFLAAQSKSNDKGFLSKEILVSDLILEHGDIHHLFPKDYLRKNGFGKRDYNQIANYVYMQSEINIKVGNKSPKEYFSLVKEQIQNQAPQISPIISQSSLQENLQMNCIPFGLMDMQIENYQEFLSERRKLMSQKIRKYDWLEINTLHMSDDSKEANTFRKFRNSISRTPTDNEVIRLKQIIFREKNLCAIML
jgi:hypothetical protein